MQAQTLPRFTAGSVVNAASFLPGPVAPGQLIAIFGVNLGPEPGIPLQLSPNGYVVSQSLGGVRVLFDGIPAPMVYASSGQLNCIVPYEVDQSNSVEVMVEYNGARSAPVRLNVAPVALGIFSANATGSGIGAILNQDGTKNGLANYAVPGSVIVIYATGAGAMSNSPMDGVIAGLELSFPRTQISASVSGRPAQVLYAGAAPGLVSGVLQVNLLLPSDIPHGIVAVSLKGGASESQPNLMVSTERSDVVSRGARLLGIDTNMAEKNTYSDALAIARGAGSEVVSLSLNWDEIESSPGVYSNPYLVAQNAAMRGSSLQLSLRIRPVDTNGAHQPNDLKAKSFAHPEVADRFKRLMDFVLAQLGDSRIVSISIGNEIDVAFGLDQRMWADYKSFYDSVVSYLHLKYPAIRLGVAMSFDGLTTYARDFALAMNEKSSVIMVNDYPMFPGYLVKDPSSVRVSFDLLARLYPDRPIHFTEIGYPSSPVNFSSDDKQKSFVDEVFKAWDAHAAQIEYLSFSWLTDLPQSRVDDYRKYYNISGLGFGEFLRTLGLRSYPGSGTDKAAFQALKYNAYQRGWPANAVGSSGSQPPSALNSDSQ